MTERPRVLVADDDPLIQRLVRTHLDRAGFRVLSAGDGEEALDVAAAEQPDLIVLDLMLPKLDGFEVCRRLREFSLVPVVMLTARGEQVDKMKGFEAGADDYLTKPFAPPELLARVRAVLRRTQQGGPTSAPSIVRCGSLAIDFVRRRVMAGEEVVKLTPTEFQLLQQLALNAGKVLSHTELLTKVWGPHPERARLRVRAGLSLSRGLTALSGKLRSGGAALASVRSGAAGRVARTPFGLLPPLPLGTPFAEALPCRWAGGHPGNLLRGADGCRITRGMHACGGQQPVASSSPSP